ncbi:MAG TPA: hypothetical protein VKC56_01195 [Gallionellaceae bacterium]|nr:hypothetical protein [Gallionellaceae bacterium]
MPENQNTDMARQGKSENPDAISNDESVLDFLWGSEAAAVPDGQAEMPEQAAQEAVEGEDLTGALARYGSWLNSLDGAS